MRQKSLRETTREDGMKIISRRLMGINTVRVGAVARVGSSFDPNNLHGLFHAFEHMGFQGTERRSADEIDSYTEEYLSSYNAYTDSLWTNFYGEAASSCFPQLCDLIFDCYLHSTFPEDRLAKEKSTICGEIRIAHDDDYRKAHAALIGLLWEKNPLRISGVGTIEHVKSITKQLLLETRSTWYIPSNTVIIGTGKIDHDLLVAKVNEAFSLDHRLVPHPQWDLEFPRELAKKENAIKKPDRNGAIIMTGCKIGVPTERESYMAWILRQMLGSGANSLLWQEMRMKREAYTVWGYIDGSNRLGRAFLFGTEIDPDRLDEAKELLYAIPCEFELSVPHFMRTKQGLIRNISTHLETPHAWERAILFQIIDHQKDLSTFHNYATKRQKVLESISFEETDEFRKKILTRDRMALVTLAP